MFWKKAKWSKAPGCFERHLQRRDGNILFPPERRIVSKEEIEQAQRRDKMDQERFVKDIKEFAAQLNISENIDSASIPQTSSVLQKVQALIEEGTSIGGNIENEIHFLENVEEKLIHILNEAMPEGRHLMEQAKSLSVTARIPYLAQSKRKDTPILENEHAPTILSEDLATVSVIGYVSRSFSDFKPSETDITKHLDEAVRQGFNEEQAQEMINAWNEIQ